MTRPSLFLALFGLALPFIAGANPPAPSYTIYGSIRSEDGRPLAGGEGVVVVSIAPAGEVARGPVDVTLGQGINYTLQIPMDAGISADLYKPTASSPKKAFTVQVLLGSKTFVPISVAGRVLDTDHPSVRERFDFVLGVDSDGDGLPDSWEQALIDAGTGRGLNSLASVKAGDDFDGDGHTNLDEFLAGTDPMSADEGVFLDVLGMENGIAHLRFAAARGRTYTIRVSDDLKAWMQAPISTKADGTEASAYHLAADSGPLDVYVTGDPEKRKRFFKLYVE